SSIRIYTLSLHDALPISAAYCEPGEARADARGPNGEPPTALSNVRPVTSRASTSRARSRATCFRWANRRPVYSQKRLPQYGSWRSEEHTSELQSRSDLVC